ANTSGPVFGVISPSGALSTISDGLGVASAAAVCLAPGDGITVQTDQVAGFPAATYAAALAIAGVRDTRIVIDAPVSRPTSGASALGGALQAAYACQPFEGYEPHRVNLAYEQMTQAMALGAGLGDPTRAGVLMLKVTQQVLTRRLAGETVIA